VQKGRLGLGIEFIFVRTLLSIDCGQIIIEENEKAFKNISKDLQF